MEKETGYVWHYTVGTPLAEIARSGSLLPAAARTPDPRSCEEILWFSRNQQWDPSAMKDDGLSQARHALTRAALHMRFGLYRFGLPALIFAWYRGRPSRVWPTSTCPRP
jgi:hypothetical protein